MIHFFSSIISAYKGIININDGKVMNCYIKSVFTLLDLSLIDSYTLFIHF